jgi:hypothetical protein
MDVPQLRMRVGVNVDCKPNITAVAWVGMTGGDRIASQMQVSK